MYRELIDDIENCICDKKYIKRFITNSMSYKLFTTKLKTQGHCYRKIGFEERLYNANGPIDEIYYTITEYIIKLSYEDIYTDEIQFSSELFSEMTRIWIREANRYMNSNRVLASIAKYDFHEEAINYFIYFFICKSTNHWDRTYYKDAKRIYDKLLNTIIEIYASEMSQKIAIDKIKRNKIYNLGLGLKLSIRTFNEIM
jgi:hypothetical protein